MVKINTNTPSDWKANETDQTQDVRSAENQDLLNRIDEAISQINDAQAEWDEYLTDEQRAEMERLKATLTAESAAIEGGSYYNPLTGEIEGANAIDYAQRDALSDLGTGWNGGIISNFSEDEAKLDAEDGTYMGSVEIEASGRPMDPTKVGFSIDDAFEAELMGEGGTLEQVLVRSEGRDLVVTAIGKDAEGNEVRKSWVIKEGTVRPEPIIFNFTGMSHGITFDASRAYRISDGNYNSYYGTVRGFYVHGTAFDDTIYGSQGDDKIVAWEGDDYIDAMAGNDTVWGDDYYEVGGSFSPDGGRDTIRGGAGSDTLYGGANMDTRFESDNPTPTNPEATYEMEYRADDETGALPSVNGSWLNAPGWIASEEDGMIVVEHDAPTTGEITINMPDGYSMAFAEVGPDGKSLIITFVGEGPDGKPQTFQLKIKDFLDSSAGMNPDTIMKLKIIGSAGDEIIDFSKVRGLTNQVINIEGGAGDDIILGASNELLSQGIEYDDLVESSTSGSILNNMVNSDEVIYNDDGGYAARYDSDLDQIVIGLDPDFDTSEGQTRDKVVQLVAPEGFETGYIANAPDGSGDLLVIMINPTTKETIVVRIESATGLSSTDILVANLSGSNFDVSGDSDDDHAEKFGTPWGLIAISLDESDYTINGGTGADLIFAPKGTNFVTDSEDDVIEGNFEDGAGLNNAPAADSETE